MMLILFVSAASRREMLYAGLVWSDLLAALLFPFHARAPEVTPGTDSGGPGK